MWWCANRYSPLPTQTPPQEALAAALPTRIPAPLGWRRNLALVQLGQLTETLQRMRVTLRQREQSEEALCVWVKVRRPQRLQKFGW